VEKAWRGLDAGLGRWHRRRGAAFGLDSRAASAPTASPAPPKADQHSEFCRFISPVGVQYSHLQSFGRGALAAVAGGIAARPAASDPQDAGVEISPTRSQMNTKLFKN